MSAALEPRRQNEPSVPFSLEGGPGRLQALYDTGTDMAGVMGFIPQFLAQCLAHREGSITERLIRDRLLTAVS